MIPLSAINGLSPLTMSSNGQARRPIQKFANRPVNFESNLKASQVPTSNLSSKDVQYILNYKCSNKVLLLMNIQS